MRDIIQHVIDIGWEFHQVDLLMSNGNYTLGRRWDGLKAAVRQLELSTAVSGYLCPHKCHWCGTVGSVDG